MNKNRYLSTLSIIVLVSLAMLSIPVVAIDSIGTVTRNISSITISPGENITITLTPSDNLPTNPVWGVTETLPSGFVFVSTDADNYEDIGNNQYRFSKLGSGVITYTVIAPTTKGVYNIYGSFVDANQGNGTINTTIVTVSIKSKGVVTRSMPLTTISPGENITITLTPSDSLPTSPGWGVTETLPSGFVFVSTDADSYEDLGDNQYRFTKIGSGVITYTTTVPSTEGTYTISGTFVDADKGEGVINTTQIIIAINIVDVYDTNGIPGIQKDEAINALNDYLFGDGSITKEDAIEVLNAYLFS